MSSRTLVRGASVALTAALGVALLVPSPAISSIDGQFTAEGSATLLDVDLLNAGVLIGEDISLLKASLSNTDNAADNSGGLADGASASAAVNGINVELGPQNLIPDTIPLAGDASQTAPPDNTEPADGTLVDLSAADPLLTGSILPAKALARDPNAIGCDDLDADNRAIITDALVSTTDLGVLNAGDFELITVSDDDGTVDTRSTTYVTGDGAIISESYSQTASINVAGEALLVEVVNPSLTATASGQPGGATVEYTGEVRVNGEKIAGIQTYELSVDLLGIDIPLDPILGPLNESLLIATVTVADPTTDVAADGTSASGSISVVRIEVFPADLTGNTLGDAVITVDYSPLTASATVPVGGVNINCGGVQDPFSEVAKDVTAAKVRPGTSFDYALTIPNRAECTVTDVVVTDTISGVEDFTIAATDPTGTVSGKTITWGIDELKPNETRTFKITVDVGPNATGTFVDNLNVTGVCDGEDVDGEDELSLPAVTTEKLLGCDVSASNKASTHLEVMPGQTYSYLVHAYNAGDQDCGKTTVTDTLPAGATFVSCTNGCTDAGQTVTWTLDNLAAGEAVTLVVTVSAPDSDEDLTNTAVIAPTNGASTTVTDPGPDVTDQSVLAPPKPADFTGAADQQLPRTGGGLALLGLAGIAAGSRLRKRS